MNVIWFLILVSGTVAMLFTDPDGAIRAMLTGSGNAVTLAMTLIATYGFWLGFFALMDKTGVSDADDKTRKYISMNISANLLGLGNASTPMGINAINSMNKGAKYATTDMIMLVVISATSLQLIPSTVIGMRIAHGSNAPTAFLLPCMLSTVTSTVVGVMLVKLFSRIFGEKPRERKKKKAATPSGAAFSPPVLLTPRPAAKSDLSSKGGKA